MAFLEPASHRTNALRQLQAWHFVLAVLLAALTSCAGDSARPGNPAVYERIEGMTDCAALQTEFDLAMNNHDRASAGTEERRWTLAYARTADDRMREVGCYG